MRLALQNIAGQFPRCVRADRNASASVEFALSGLALMAFIFVIINLGDLGLVLGALRHGVQGAVRDMAVQTGVSLANNNSCVSSGAAAGYFSSYAAPLLPTASSTPTPGFPTVTATWTNDTASNTVQGTYVTVTASYLWTPIGLPNYRAAGVPLSVTATQMVVGTSGAVTACS
jgi:hypothetical protein